MTDRYYARSASDKTDEWPFWFVADKLQGGLNVTNPLLKKNMGLSKDIGGIFLPQDDAVYLAAWANDVAAQESEGK